MTFSILVRDPVSGALGGAAATGSYCVGGWVLRGDLRAGMSASQGASPSTFWGEDVLAEMRAGATADEAVAQATGADDGRDWRQLSALDPGGGTGAFTGARNTPEMGHEVFAGGVVAGNMLAGLDVLGALRSGFETAQGSLGRRLITALQSAEAAGGDSRGLLSAALLVLHPDDPPLTLRIDYHPGDPISALADLHDRATTGDYAEWVRQVPVVSDRMRILGG